MTADGKLHPWYLWCPRCGRVGKARLVTTAQLSRLYDEHQAACPRRSQAAAEGSQSVEGSR